MKKLCALLSLLFMFAFVNPNPFEALSTTDFITQVNCIGAGCPSTTTTFPSPAAVSSAYPSPLGNSEQAAIYVPNNFTYRGYDQSYAVVCGGNYTVPNNGGREAEGRIAVGGNLVINQPNYGIAQSGGGTFVVGDGGSTFPVAVQGTVSGTGTLGVGFSKGGAYIVRSGGANSLASSGGSAGQTKSQNQGSSGVDIAGIISGMQTISANMLATTPTSTTFTGTNVAKETITINNSSILGNPILTNIAPGATVVVNVKGTGNINVGWTAQIGRAGQTGVTDGDARVYNVIFNFCEATKVTFNTAFVGTVLIPNGGAEINHAFDGRLYLSGSLVHAGESSEIHNYPFTGNLTTYSGSPLPVKLASFQAQSTGMDVALNWNTESEANFSHFEVNHSMDAKNWEEIGTVLPEEGVMKTYKAYTFKHAAVKPGNHFYKLKMVDLDGTSEFSRIRNVQVDGNLKLLVQPNPVASTFTISGVQNPDHEAVLVDIYAPNGKLIQQYKRKENDGLDFQVPSNWPSGILMVKVQVGQGASKVFKVHVQ